MVDRWAAPPAPQTASSGLPLDLCQFGVGVGSLEFLSVVTRSSGLVCCLLAILGRRPCKASSCLSVVVGCVVIWVALCLYRVAFIGVVLVRLGFFYESDTPPRVYP
jgi:hypothetical protein